MLAIVLPLLPPPPTNISSPLPPIFHFRSLETHIKWNLFTPSLFSDVFSLIPRAVAGKVFAWSWVMRMHETVRRWPHNVCEVLIVFLNWKPSFKQTEHHSAWASVSQVLTWSLCKKATIPTEHSMKKISVSRIKNCNIILKRLKEMKLINVLIPKDRITENYHCLTLIRWGRTWWFQIAFICSNESLQG